MRAFVYTGPTSEVSSSSYREWLCLAVFRYLGLEPLAFDELL